MLIRMTLLRSKLLTVMFAMMLAACSEQLSHDELLGRARQALKEDKIRAALIDVKTALQQDGSSTGARRLYGEILLKQRRLDEAIIEFSKSLESEKVPEVATLYAQAMLDSGQQDQLLSQMLDGDFVFALDDAAFLALISRAQIASGDTFSAQQTLEEALAVDPDNPQVQLSRAALLISHTKEVDKASEVLQELTANHPEFEEGWSAYGRLAQASGDLATAELAYRRVSDLNRFRLEERLGLVAVLVEQEKYDDASLELEKLDKIIPEHPHVNYAQAVIAMASGNPEGALEELAQVFNVTPGHLPSVYLAANANYSLGNPEAAEGYLTTFLAAQPRNLSARQMAATVFLQSGEPEKAASIARQLVQDFPENLTSLEILALSLAAQGKHAQSAEIHTMIAKISPDSAAVRMALGSELVLAADYARGIEELEFAKELDANNVDIRSRLVLARAANGDMVGALAEIEEYRQVASAEDPQPSQLAARLALMEGDKERAREEFAKALELSPTSPVAWQGLASVAMLEDDSEEALGILNNVLQSQPDNLQALLDLSAVHQERGETEAMVKTLQRAVEAHPEALEPRLGLARHWLKEERPAETVALLMEVRELHADDPRLHQLLTGGFLALGQPDAAINSSRTMLQLLPDSPRGLRLAAQAERAGGNLAKSEAHLRKLLKLVPRDTRSRLMLLDILIAQNKLDELEEELELVPVGMAEEFRLDRTRGRAAFATRDFEKAEKWFGKAYRAHPDKNFLLDFSAALWAQEKTAEAIASLEDWRKSHPEDFMILAQLGVFYQQLGQDDNAVEIYEAMNGLKPGDIVILNNLAWSLRKSDQDLAMKYVDEALALAPDNDSALDTKSLILLQSGANDEALAANRAALDKSPENLDYVFHRAQILAAAGDKATAVELLEQLLAPDAGFGNTAEAEALMARLKP